MKRITYLLVAITLAAVAGVNAQGAQDPAQLLRQAINKETVDGDCKTAIELYRKVAAGPDQTLAAKALLRMGDCQQKVGNADAVKTYEQIVQKHPSSPEAAEAKGRLAALRTLVINAGKSERVVWSMKEKGEQPLAVSNSGRFGLFISSDAYTLVLRDLASGTDRPLTKGPEGDVVDGFASFSRDDSQVAFNWYNKKEDHDELRVVSLGGTGTPANRVLVSEPGIMYLEPYNWTSDGQRIAVMISRKDSHELALVSVRDGSVTVLKKVARDIALGPVAISPDDRFVAFSSAPAGGASDIFIVGIDGTGETNVVQHRAMDTLIGWSADGRLVYSSDRTGSPELMALAMQNGRVAGAAQALQVGFASATSLGLSSTGALHYYVQSDRTIPDIKVASIDPRTGQMSPLSDLVTEYETGDIGSPDYSDNGKLIAYTISPARQPIRHMTVAIRSLDTGTVRRLDTNLRFIAWLRWVPGDSALCAMGLDDKTWATASLFRIDATSGATTLVAAIDEHSTISLDRWSADGRTVVYRRTTNGSTELRLIERDMSTGSERELLHIGPDTGVADAHISPDWRTIYYRKNLNDGSKVPFQSGVFVAHDLVTGTERELARGALGSPNLSPDGRYLVTPRNDVGGKTRSILLIPVDGGQPRELFKIDLPQAYLNRTATANPLGVYKQPPSSDVIIVARNFGTEGARIDRSEFWWVPIDGRTPKLLDVGAIRELRVSPDNRRIAVLPRPSDDRHPLEVKVLQNFLPVK